MGFNSGFKGLKVVPLEISKIVLAKIYKEKKSNTKEEVSKSQISTEFYILSWLTNYKSRNVKSIITQTPVTLRAANQSRSNQSTRSWSFPPTTSSEDGFFNASFPAISSIKM